MKQVACAVFDRASQLYGRPFFVAAAGQAVRSFTDEVNRKDRDSEMSRHPDDFDLYQLAIFDDNAGEFFAELRILARGKDVLTQEA